MNDLAGPVARERSFIHYRRAWYAFPGGLPEGVVDEVYFSALENDAPVCSLRVEWVPGGDGTTPRLIAFSDEWKALTLMRDVLEAMAARDGLLTEPRVFCQLLSTLGFIDATPVHA